MTSSTYSQDSRPESIVAELKSLLDTYRNSSDSTLASALFTEIEAVIEGLDETAGLHADPLFAEIDGKIDELGALQKQLLALKVDAVTTSTEWQKRFRYSDGWWRHELALLRGFEDDPVAFRSHWFERFAQALLDWRFDACQRLGQELLGLEAELVDEAMLDVVFRMMFAASAIENDDYSKEELLTTLDELLHIHLTEEQTQLRIQLMIFIGRIYLYRRSDRIQAEHYLADALERMPDDGRAQAAMGHYHLENDSLTLANRAFVSAINLAPREPDGYIGLGLLAEASAQWAEASSWFEKAIETVATEPDPLLALTKCLSPVSGNLYQHLAGYLLQQGVNQQAFEAAKLALANSPQDGSDYPERHAYGLKAMAAEALGLVDEAADAYLEAGKCYLWRNNFEKASDNFEKAVALAPNNADGYWYLADTLRIQSVSLEPPYPTDPEILQRSLDVWNAGAALGPISGESGWAFFARTAIEDLWSRLPNADRRLHLWEAVRYAESGFLLDATPQRKATLATALRSVDLDSNALFLADDVDITTNDVEQLQAFIGSMLNVGEIDELEPYLLRLIELTESDEASYKYYQGWHIFYHYVAGNFERASKLADQWFAADTDDPWERELRAFAHLHAGRRSGALTDCRWLWARRDPNDGDSQRLYGLSGLVLDQVEEAIPYLERATNAVTDRFSSWLMLGVAQVALGLVEEAALSFEEALAQSTTKRTLASALIDLAYFSQQWPDAEKALALESVMQRLENMQASSGGVTLDPLKELANFRDEISTPLTPGWIAARLIEGRLHISRENWTEAANAYATLRDEAALPQAEVGLANVALGLRNHARLQLADAEEIQRLFAIAAELGLVKGTTADAIEWQIIEALSALINGDQEKSVDCFSAIVNALAATTFAATTVAATTVAATTVEPLTDPAKHLADTTRSLLPDIESYWLVYDLWQGLGLRFEEATSYLQSYLDEHFGLLPSQWASGQYAPAVTPIAVEVSNNLIPADTSEEWALFKTHIPAMRERVKQDMGINLPGVRIRGNEGDMPPDSYIILIDEVPLIMGTVYPDHLFCDLPPEALTAAGIPPSDMEAAPHPITRQPGAWVAAQHYPTVQTLNCLIWDDPYLYIIHHLETIIRARLNRFITLQELDELMAEWRSGENGVSLVDAALPDDLTRIRFVRLLHQLLDEGVTIADWKTLLEAVQQVGLPDDDIFASLESIRIALKPCLPGNQPEDKRLALPDALEEMLLPGLHEDEGQRFFALAPEPTQDFLNQFRALVGAQDALVVVVANGKLRPHLRSLLQLEFPFMYVIAEGELLNGKA